MPLEDRFFAVKTTLSKRNEANERTASHYFSKLLPSHSSQSPQMFFFCHSKWMRLQQPLRRKLHRRSRGGTSADDDDDDDGKHMRRKASDIFFFVRNTIIASQPYSHTQILRVWITSLLLSLSTYLRPVP